MHTSVERDIDVIFPGREVELEGGVKVKVYPMRVKHIKRVVKAVEGGLPRLLQMFPGVVVGDGLSGDDGKRLIATAVAIVIDDLLDVLGECVSGADIAELPQWALPPIAEAWCAESFGTAGKVRPWVEAMESLLTRITGKKTGLWDKLCSSLSQAGTG